MTRIVDLRSDTVTRPVAEMRRAIAEAQVGDDVFGDDPTVNRLEERMAALFGTEAALFVPSGTMANTTALSAITQPGDELILDRTSHIFFFEVAAVPTLLGVQFNPLDGNRGVITAEQIAPHIRPGSLHQPATAAIAIENTHNRGGGSVFPIDEMKRIRVLADEAGIKVHLDGARLANAVIATGVSFHDYTACADTVSMCFSKGLGAPVGSCVGGSDETIRKARRKRKQLGGGMRQAGVLAAAALYAIEHHIDRLAEDHRRAVKLGEMIEATEGLALAFPVITNFVVVEVGAKFGSTTDFLETLRKHDILANPFGPTSVRMVTHLDIEETDIDRVAEVLGSSSLSN